MYRQEAAEEYSRALKLGQKESRERVLAGKPAHPEVLDEILPDSLLDAYQEIGLVEIPATRIIGVKSAGRTAAFSPSFFPMLEPGSEFAAKWVDLCVHHLSDQGITQPILCYEYLGSFYIQEGNKRVSVLRFFGSPRIPGTVRRILPPRSPEPRIQAYYEFLDFYKVSRLYEVQFRKPGCYSELLDHLNKKPDEVWTEQERRTFRSYLHYFREAYTALENPKVDMTVEEALLVWLGVYPFRDLGVMTAPELKKSLTGLWGDVVSTAKKLPVQVETGETSADSKTNLLNWLTAPSHLRVAFVHQRDPESSSWIRGHEQGKRYLEQALKNKVTLRSYFHADTPGQAERLLERAVADGANVVFTTTPQLSRATIRAALKYPKVKFLNCSVNVPYHSIRTYYSRVYEAKFITGAIAGAMATNNRIGYIGNYPIYGVPASINAFALGALLTNPRARICLRWSCQEGTPVADFVKDGIRVISNRDMPTQEQHYLQFGEYGTYYVGDNGTLTTLASPCWVWGKFYEKVIRSLMDGTWDQSKDTTQPLNYWWGMQSGVVDVELSEKLPVGLRQLANILRQGLQSGTLDPFARSIMAQDGTERHDGSRRLTADELLRMDYLCHNVDGVIPDYSQVLPFARPTVRELGIYRQSLPPEKEVELL